MLYWRSMHKSAINRKVYMSKLSLAFFYLLMTDNVNDLCGIHTIYDKIFL